MLSSCCNPVTRWEGIRCLGDCRDNSEKQGNAKMHDKFLIFCKRDIRFETIIDENLMKKGLSESRCEVEIEIPVLEPLAIWTGSFNLTNNAVNSFENALYITNSEVVYAYYDEWCQLLALSESLNWKSEHINPEWEIEK